MASLVRVGDPAPDFSLSDLEGAPHHLSHQRGRLTALNFWSATYPWSQYGDEVLAALGDTHRKNIAVWRIASKDGESNGQMQEPAAARHNSVPLDSDHLVADPYGAMTTPYVFVIDEAGILQYTGAIDDTTFRHRTPSRHYLVEAIGALLNGRQAGISLTPGYGCAIVRRDVSL